MEGQEQGSEAVDRVFGGRDRDRTGDPLLAKQVLSQLSYTPTARTSIDFRAIPAVRKLLERILDPLSYENCVKTPDASHAGSLSVKVGDPRQKQPAAVDIELDH